MSKKFSLDYQSWRKTLYGHLALARISNSPTVVSNALAGAALAGARLVDGKQALVAIAMVLFYSAGMYLNDLLDYAVDCRERPERPLPTGIVSRRGAAIGVIALFGCGSILLGIVGLYPFLSGLVLIALIICYDRWHKRNPFSPLLMALCRGMVYVTAFVAFSAQSLFNLLFPCCLLILYVIGLTSIAKVEPKGTDEREGQSRENAVEIAAEAGTISTAPVREVGARGDHASSNVSSPRADRGLRRGTCPGPPPSGGESTSLSGMDRQGGDGSRRWLANVGIVVTLFLPSVYFVARPSLFSLLFALLFTAWVIYSIFFIYEAPQRQVGRAVGQLIAGIALLDSLVLVVSENYHGLLLALLAFGLTLFLQRYVKGT